MFSSLALENMNSVSPELTWKPFAKGRRSQKSVARNFGTRKRLKDTLLSCSDKVDGSVRGQSTSRSKEKALERKRRKLDLLSSSMKLDLSTGFSEENEQPLCPKYPSEDLSGIELLAAVASMDDDFVKAREDLPESSLVPRCSDAATSTSHSKELPKPNGLDSSLCDKTFLGGNSGFALVLPESAASSETLCRSPNEHNTHKVIRQHWDLNIVMDAWVEPFGSNAIDMPLGEKQKDSEDQLLRNPIGKTDECPNPRTEDSESAVARDNICCQLTYRKEDASSFAGECHDQITRVDVDKRNINQVLVWDSCLEPAKQVKMTEATTDSSLLHKPDFSGTLMQVGPFVESTGTNVKLQDEGFSSNVVLCANTLACDKAHRNTRDLTVCDLHAIEVSESTIGVQCNDSNDCIMVSGRSRAPISMDNVIPCTLRSHSDDNKNNSEAKLMMIPKQVDNIETNDEVKGSIMAGSRAQCIDPSVCVETNDLSVADSPHYDQGHMVGDDVTRHVEMYDSSYEDGELRGSFLYALEDNALENESVNYESDGRYVDDLSADGHTGYGILEGGSEASHGSETGNVKENESVTRSLRHLVNNDLNDDPDNNEVSGNVESNAGSGTTVDHSLDVIIGENDNCMKRRKVTDRRDLFARKSRDADGYPYKFAARLSYIDSLDRMNPYPIQRCRSNRYSDSVSHTTREDVTLERYRGRHRPIRHSERDQIDQSAHWPSKKRFTPRYQGAKDRGYSRPITTTASGEFNRFNDGYYWKTTNNMPIGLHKPFIRKSPLHRDDSFGIHTRSPFGLGTSRFKSRGYHSQRAGREFAEQLEPQPEHDTARAPHLPRYSSTRERNFSPSSDTVARFNKRFRRSRSRSRTPPRRVLQSHKDQSLNTMKHGRSQDFGYKVRIGRPFSKSAFASEYEDNYSSPSHRRFSPIRRLVDDHGSVRADNNIRHRRSPVRHPRRDHKVDSVGHYPLRRFSFKPSSGRESKFESSSNYGCDDNGEVKRRDNGGNLRSLGTGRDLEKGSLDNGK